MPSEIRAGVLLPECIRAPQQVGKKLILEPR